MSKSGPNYLKNIFGRFNRDNIDEEAVEEEIKSIVNEGHENGMILADEAEMISNIFEFGDKEARDIMTIRQKISAVEKNMTLVEAINYMLVENYSRYPIYDEEIDNIIGILHLKDAMRSYMSNQDVRLTDISKEAYFVHETQSIQKLFKKMQSDKIHMAIVIDEYGQTCGVIAMEDILEVIVGDILDENEEEEKNILKLGKEDTYLIKGLTRLDDISDELEIEFPDEDIDTLNGFLLYKLGRLPVEHENIEIVHDGFLFAPVDIHDNMIVQVKVSKLSELDVDD